MISIFLAILLLSIIFGFWIMVIIYAIINFHNETIIDLELTEEDELEIWNCLRNN